MSTTPSEKKKRRQGRKAYRLSADGIQEIKRGMEGEKNRLIDEFGMKWEGAEPKMRNVLNVAHIMNGLMTWFLGFPQSVRDEILKEGLELYIKRLDGNSKAPFIMPAWKMAKTRGAGGYAGDNGGNSPKSKGKNLGTDADD